MPGHLKFLLWNKSLPSTYNALLWALPCNETKHLVEAVRIHIDLPPGFPEKYKKTVIKTAELCTVKKNMADPPRFLVTADIQN